jgi:hypothetical protein
VNKIAATKIIVTFVFEDARSFLGAAGAPASAFVTVPAGR